MHRTSDRVGPVRVVLLCHSYVRRLDEYMQRIPCRRNLGFANVDVTVHCVAWGGGTARHGRRCMAHLLPDVVALNPHIIFVNLGENDLPHESPSSLCNLYCDLLRRLYTVCPVIIVGQLLPFPRCPRNHPLVAATNERLAHVPRHPGFFWRHRCGFFQPSSARLFLPDRIHLNNTGMARYWASVRTAVGQALQQRR